MGILNKILGAPDAANKVLDGAINGLDKAFFTKEERSEAGKNLAEWYLRYLEATQPQNYARRIIAFIVVSLWASLIIFCVAAYKYDAAWGAYTFDLMKDVVLNPFLMIMAFYFATHVVRAWTQEKK